MAAKLIIKINQVLATTGQSKNKKKHYVLFIKSVKYRYSNNY